MSLDILVDHKIIIEVKATESGINGMRKFYFLSFEFLMNPLIVRGDCVEQGVLS